VPLLQAEKILKDAERELEQLTRDHEAFAPAWFNLAQVKKRLLIFFDGAERAAREEQVSEAWQNYLRHEARADFRDLVRESLGVEPPD
jgi:hypothetical protein